MAIVPAAGLGIGFQQVQKIYAIVGALFIPMLALVLLILCGREYRNSPLTSVLLAGGLAFFVFVLWLKI